MDTTEMVMLVEHLQLVQFQLEVAPEEGVGKREPQVPTLVMVLEALEVTLHTQIRMEWLALMDG